MCTMTWHDSHCHGMMGVNQVRMFTDPDFFDDFAFCVYIHNQTNCTQSFNRNDVFARKQVVQPLLISNNDQQSDDNHVEIVAAFD